MSAKDFQQQTAQDSNSLHREPNQLNPSLPQSNQEMLQMLENLRNQNNRVNSSMGMVGAGNSIVGPSIQNWRGTQNSLLNRYSGLMQSSNAQSNLQMLQGNMSYADSQRAMRLSQTQARLTNQQRGLARIGNQLGTGQQLMGHGLKGAGIVTSGLGGFTDTGVNTNEGRAANAIAQVGGSQIAGRAVSLPVALTDLAVSTAMKSPLGQNLPNSVRNTSIGGTVSDSITATTSLAEAAITGDTSGAERFHKESLRGDRGAILQAGSATGEAIKSVTSGNISDYVDKAGKGKYGPVAQFGNALGEGAYKFLHGDPEKAPDQRRGLLNGWGLFGNHKK